MAEYSKLVITNAGQTLMAKMIAGEGNIEFTKVCASSAEYVEGDLQDLTSLDSIEQETLVSKVTRTNDVAIKIEAAFSNAELTTGYYMRTLGLYAVDPDNGEILYAVCIETTNNCYMPAYNGVTVSAAYIQMYTTVGNADSVSLEVNPGAYATVGDIQTLEEDVETHTDATVSSEAGVHGFRYYNDEFQVMNESGEWVEIETGSGIAPSNVTDAKVKSGNGKLTIYWSDPGDTVIEGQVLCTWAGTKLVQKVGSYPENVSDGTLLVDNKVLDTYKTDGFEINGLTNGTTYYFALFPYADTGATNISDDNRLSGTPQPYKIMTAVIDLSNSNPETCVTYADDAESMTAGSSDWDEFFGHYPVLLKDGVEVGKLNPNNFDEFEDGTTADISSGDDGDAMICFPRRGLTITTSDSIVTISMTDDPDNADFEYNAHTRGETAKEQFYLGVYKGYASSSVLRSLKGKTPTASQTISTFRRYAQANGDGYEQSGFYQLIFRQCMYILKYANLNSQDVIGEGYTLSDHSASTTTGGSEAYGMDCEIIRESTPSYMTDANHHVKLFGLEDFWGNIYEWIDGLVTNSSWEILTGNDDFNDSGTGYTNNGSGGVSADTSGYMSVPQGTTKTGFVAKTCGGSSTTYFCDSAYLYDGCVAIFGGGWIAASGAGAFRLHVDVAASSSSAYFASRLMYL